MRAGGRIRGRETKAVVPLKTSCWWATLRDQQRL